MGLAGTLCIAIDALSSHSLTEEQYRERMEAGSTLYALHIVLQSESQALAFFVSENEAGML